jgi:hypothetical protein
VNRTIGEFLRSLTESSSEWFLNLPKATITYNNTKHAQLGVSPTEFLLGREHHVTDSIVLPEGERIWKCGNPKFLPFFVGQYVMKKIPMKGRTVNCKFSPKYEGPYRVVVANPNSVTYVIESEDGQQIRAHHAQLIAWKVRPMYIKECLEAGEISESEAIDSGEIEGHKVRDTYNLTDVSLSSSGEISEMSYSRDSCNSLVERSPMRKTAVSFDAPELVERDVGQYVACPIPEECCKLGDGSEINLSINCNDGRIQPFPRDTSVMSDLVPVNVLPMMNETWEMSIIEPDPVADVDGASVVDEYYTVVGGLEKSSCSELNKRMHIDTVQHDEPSSGSFSGFDADDAGSVNSKNLKLAVWREAVLAAQNFSRKKLRHDKLIHVRHSESDVRGEHSARRWTRSCGSVDDLPNVQQRILEYAHRRGSESDSEIS